jgi:hypothetical protein
MPVDRKYPGILHCFVCRRPWKKKQGPLPKRCAYRDCASRRWLDGIDHRAHVQDSDVPMIGRQMMDRAHEAIQAHI